MVNNIGDLNSLRQELNSNFVSRVRASLSSDISIASTGFIGADKQSLESAITEVPKGSFDDQAEAFSDIQTRSAVNRAYADSGDFYILPLYTKDGNYLAHYIFSSRIVGGNLNALGMIEEAFVGSKDINLVLNKLLSRAGPQATLVTLGGMSSGLHTVKDLHWLSKDNVGINVLSGKSYQLVKAENVAKDQSFNIVDQNVIIIDVSLQSTWKEVEQ